MAQAVEKVKARQTQEDERRASRAYRWTSAQYHEMAQMGWFDAQKVELVDGEIWQMMGIGDKHWIATNRVTRALSDVFPRDKYIVSTQCSLKLRDGDEPEPDVAVIEGDLRTLTSVPTTALLVVEVSDATLRRDASLKASMYARARIEEYWVVDVNNNRLMVFRNPIEDGSALLGWNYASTQLLTSGQSIAPLSAPDSLVAVADLLL